MKGTPDNTVILHWDECRMSWAELPWQDWVRFRGVGAGRQSLLAGAKAGEHYFLVCVLGHCGELANVIPHKYVLSADARLVHGFDGLEETERQELCRLDALLLPTIEDSERYNELTHEFYGQPASHTYRGALAANDAWSRGCAAQRCVLAVSFCYWNLSFERQPGRPRHTIARIGSSVPAQIDGFADVAGGLR